MSDLPASPALAQLACLTCKLRKKGCNKNLPACSYCIQRGLNCQYVTQKPPEPTVRLQSFVLPPLSRKERPQDIPPSMTSCLLLTCGFSDFSTPTSHLTPPPESGPMTTDTILSLQAHRIIQATGQTIDEILTRYFQGNHRWLPFIAVRQFRNQIACPLTAEASILLLSICLITYDPTQPPTTLIDQESLYLATKMLFAQFQALVPISTSLIQAAALISIYEFARGQLRTAYISIGTCIRMAYAIGLHSFQPVIGGFYENEDDLKAEEKHNLWWGIVICERIFSGELMPLDHPLASIFPGTNYPLPLDIECSEQLPHNDPTMSPPPSPHVYRHNSGFARSAQAACLLERLIDAIKIREVEGLHNLLSELDMEMREFLGTVMNQCDGTWGIFCGSIAMTVRALFTLHRHVLRLPAETKMMEEWHKSSLAALDTISRIMVDIAYSHSRNLTQSNIDALPPACLYILLASLEHISIKANQNDEVLRRDREALINMAAQFKRRWSIE